MKYCGRHILVAGLLALAPAVLGSSAEAADKKYGPGATDTEIKIGQTMPYSGPLSAYGVVGKAELAYFAMINEQGGINGRKIKLISLDDGYSPPKTVEMTRQLIENEGVLAIFGTVGTAGNTAIEKYLNSRQVPQVFVASGASKWGDPDHFPWTMGVYPNYRTEGTIYGRYVLQNHPGSKVAVLYQDDDGGKDYLKGITDGLGDKAASMLVKAVSFEVSDPTVDSQVVTLQSTGADMFMNMTPQKQGAQAIRKAYDIGWRPVQIVSTLSASVAAVLRPAGLEKSKGVITAAIIKDPTDKTWANDPGYKDWVAWMQKYYPDGSLADPVIVGGYTYAQLLVQVLKQCGDDLTRENFMRQAANLQHVVLPMLLPGIEVNTSRTNYYPIRNMRLEKFDGEQWVLFGDVISD